MPGIGGDHARLVTWLGAVKAMYGSVITFFFVSGLGEFNLDPALRGEAPDAVVCGDRSHSNTWQSSPGIKKVHVNKNTCNQVGATYHLSPAEAVPQNPSLAHL